MTRFNGWYCVNNIDVTSTVLTMRISRDTSEDSEKEESLLIGADSIDSIEKYVL